MNIHPAWSICLVVRSALAYCVRRSQDAAHLRTVLLVFLAAVAIGFLYKALTGSNAETQFANVFWHETRIVHFLFYLAATVALYVHETTIASNVLALDVVFSILYRIATNQ